MNTEPSSPRWWIAERHSRCVKTILVQAESRKDAQAKLDKGEGEGTGEGTGEGPGVGISGPTKFRQGIGQRIPPQYSEALASLRRIY